MSDIALDIWNKTVRNRTARDFVTAEARVAFDIELRARLEEEVDARRREHAKQINRSRRARLYRDADAFLAGPDLEAEYKQ